MTKADEILALKPESIAQFITEHLREKTLSSVVKTLNADLIDGDPGAYEKARAALSQLGMLEIA